jgi:hypothetical protein
MISRQYHDGRESSQRCERIIGHAKKQVNVNKGLPSRRVGGMNRNTGRVAEWFKATVLKTVVGASPPWVRIPPLPPVRQKT